MDRTKIDATLDLMTAEELAEVDRFVEVWQRAGYMTSTEASAWRERIAVWRWLGREEQSQLFANPDGQSGRHRDQLSSRMNASASISISI